MIKEYDIELINKILESFNLKYTTEVKNGIEKFRGYKYPKSERYSFFFSMYKKEGLIFSFRFNPESNNKKRIYVTYENVDVIRKIINAILNKTSIDESEYEKYLLIIPEDELTTDNEKDDIKIAPKMSMDGLIVIPDAIGINLSNTSIPMRLKNILEKYGINTVKQLLDLDPLAITNMEFAGKKTIKEALLLQKELRNDNKYKSEVEREDTKCFYIFPTKSNITSKPWDLEEEQLLISEFLMNESMTSISKKLDRKPIEILYKLVELKLIGNK